LVRAPCGERRVGCGWRHVRSEDSGQADGGAKLSELRLMVRAPVEWKIFNVHPPPLWGVKVCGRRCLLREHLGVGGDGREDTVTKWPGRRLQRLLASISLAGMHCLVCCSPRLRLNCVIERAALQCTQNTMRQSLGSDPDHSLPGRWLSKVRARDRKVRSAPLDAESCRRMSCRRCSIRSGCTTGRGQGSVAVLCASPCRGERGDGLLGFVY
jgi:hypothetical protein